MRLHCVTAFTLFCFCLAVSAWAGEIGTIGDRKLLDARYKVLVFEYDTPSEATWGWELAQLIAQETLGTIRGISSVGVVSLRQPVKRVALSRARIEENARTQEAAVVVWGEFYEDTETVYLHSHLRFLPEAAGLPVGAGLNLRATVGGQELQAHPPTDQVDFTPIALPKAKLAALRQAFEQSVTLRFEPSDTAPTVGEIHLREPYGIAEIRGEWMKVNVWRGPRGWVRHSTLGATEELAPVRAVVLYAQGALQFLGGAYRVAQKSFEEYFSRYGVGQEPMNLAFAHVLLGTTALRLGAAVGTVSPYEVAAKEYARAAELVPSSSAPVNYLALARLEHSTAATGPQADLQDLERRLIRAVQTTSDRDTARNLAALYHLAQTRPLLWKADPSTQEKQAMAKRQLTVLQNVQREAKQ